MVGGQFWLVRPDDGVSKGGFRKEADRERRKRFRVMRLCKPLFHVEPPLQLDPINLLVGEDIFDDPLARIAFSYLLVAILEIFLKDGASKVLLHGHFSIFKCHCRHWAMGVFSFIVYSAFMYGIYVLDWHFTIHNKDSADYGKVFSVTCKVRGKLDSPCNAVGLIDRSVLGINQMYQHPAWRRSKFVKDLHALISPVPQGTPLPLVLLGKLGELGRLSVSMEKLEKELKNCDKCQVCLT
ncbi:hypothetical protein SLEP1_g2510 [Rubroshorea leprosula]|uniref:Uncharacterized protein n=1 Tax=Rubroshorea leprosula TaxID=152421 RepID=A0AAV5HND6_9ROSI|nr:hypothetical protein SLEP1_g2510 [Rubroshorea leprosula]